MGSTKTEEKKMPKFQEDFITQNILPMAEEIAGTEFNPYTGELVAGFTPMQQQVAAEYGSLASGAGQLNQAADIYSSLGQGGQLSSENVASYMSPYQQNVIDAGLRRIGENQEMALNTMGAQASSAGAFGGSRHGIAEAETRKGFSQQAQDFVGEQQAAAYQSAVQNILADAGLQSGAAGALSQMGMNTLGAQMQTGAAQQALDQAQLQADYSQFQLAQQHPLSQLNALLAGASGIPQGYGTTTSHDPFGGLTAVGKVLGGVGSVGQGGGFGALFGASDVRLKENVQPIEGVSGIQFYTWDWNNEAKRIGVENQATIGVMAQELELKHPDLVTIGDDGYRRVNYSGLFNRIGR